jgi:hypothetical protein
MGCTKPEEEPDIGKVTCIVPYRLWIRRSSRSFEEEDEFEFDLRVHAGVPQIEGQGYVHLQGGPFDAFNNSHREGL